MSGALKPCDMYVAGSWTGAESGARVEVTSPATGEVIGSVPEGGRTDVRKAVTAATTAASAWARLSPFDRAKVMATIAEVVLDRRDDLARTLTLDQGKPLHAEAFDEVDELAEYFHMAGEDAKRIEGSMPPSMDGNKRVLAYRVPRGVVGIITPWNWPYTMPAELIAPALACGNAVVWTPAPTTSVCAVKLAECIVEADLPPGVFNLVTGPGPVVGDEVASNPGTSAVGFIGSVETGHRVAQRAAGKELLLELGGNGPVVIFEDADLRKAAAASLTSAFLCAGQSCTAGERFLIHESVHDDFISGLKSAIDGSVRLGDPFAEETTLGPLNNEPTAAKMDRHIANALDGGAELLVGGSRSTRFPTDLYYEATVLAGVSNDMDVATEETFGPIVPISTITADEDAIQAVNESPYGLLTTVWTSDLGRGLKFAEAVSAGWVNINETSNYWESHLPFGGRSGKRSGVGRVGGTHSMERFTELKTVIVNLE